MVTFLKADLQNTSIYTWNSHISDIQLTQISAANRIIFGLQISVGTNN
jgi:hypothetical protein